MSKAFFNRDLRRGEHYVPPTPWGMIRQKYPGADRVKMIKLCGKSIAYPLQLIFEDSLLGGEFPECWKWANVVPVHEKESKNLVKKTNKSSSDFWKIF